MKPDDDSWDEAQFSSLMRSADRDMPKPDPDFLARLREQSTQAFVEAAGDAARAAGVDKTGTVRAEGTARGSTQRETARSTRRSTMAKVLIGSAIAALVAVIATWMNMAPPTAQVAFGDVLREVEGARTLHLKVSRDGKEGEVWVASPGRLRWDRADGTYQVAEGPTLWLVDEKENRAARGTSEYFRDQPTGQDSFDLFSLLDVDERSRPAALDARPVETVMQEGRALLRYRVEVPREDHPLRLDALVDARTRSLQSLEITALLVDGREEPVATLNVLAVNEPVDEQKFVVRDTLTEDGRIGKIVDAQGIVSIRPVMQQRWTPVCTRLLVRPRDWLRTDVRGANAATVALVKQTRVTLGPGTLAELVSPTQLRLHTGELEAVVPETDSLEIVGPGDEKKTIRGTGIVRAEREKLAVLKAEPLWLKSFKGAAAGESLGSLMAHEAGRIDARNVPLSVGYHKVAVDVRDQIARTVIEESFVNHTGAVLEGIFSFPLPQDASISGFGMWIGEELIEADVVEKQRAREIYETILREKRDPGLLEWSGGNIFKARVFPIPGNSEKRIKISYTQVLPLRGTSYGYSYALQSELLKLHPLRELSIDVKVASAVPLKSVASPTHMVRTDVAGSSGHVEFSAQEYTPTRDFEVVFETDRRQSDVVVIPHRRGDDGYFMMQLTPPTTGAWQRDVLPDGEPLELLVLADTSASMDAAQRRTQGELVAALFSAVTPRDTINLGACDVECDWAFEKPVAADSKNVAAARDFLAKRVSLGWTDLDRAFESAFAQCGPRTHVIYIGDGIVTTGAADPDEFARRVKLLHEGKPGTCHAVAVSSSFEAAALRAIASLGGGSLRRVTGEMGPQAVAVELLREISQPGLRDLKVSFRGIQTARVYPEELSNIPVGSQQILLGLYQPEGRDQTGEVVVTGTQNGKAVKFTTKVALADAERGNSFIPRLWARMHLDSLLAQGASERIRDEVIALSEEFQIMTPYTSFLVLETDADRERFGVKRRFRMRDAEEYFQKGRDDVNFDLVHRQMKRAGTWRLGLRQSVLAQLARLGREVPVQPPSHYGYAMPEGARIGGIGFGSGGGAYPIDSVQSDSLNLYGLSEAPLGSTSDNAPLFAMDPESSDVEVTKREKAAEIDVMGDLDLADREEAFALNKELPAQMPLGEYDRKNLPDGDETFGSRTPFYEDGQVGVDFNGGAISDELLVAAKPLGWPVSDTRMSLWSVSGGRYFRPGYDGGDPLAYVRWVDTLFPALAPPVPVKKAKTPKQTWPAEALALSQSLLRIDSLARLTGGLEVDRQTDTFDARWNEPTSRGQRRELFSPGAWLTRDAGDSSQTIVNWCDGAERGVMGLAFQLGRVRKSAPQDLTPRVLSIGDYSLAPLHESYRVYTPAIEPQADGKTLLILKIPGAPRHETRVLIDGARHVILTIESRFDGKPMTTTKFDDFVEAGGSWWAQRIETFDDKNRRTSLTTQTVKPLAVEAFGDRMKAELTPREAVQFLRWPYLTVRQAKQAHAALGELTFDVPFTLLLHFARSQQWTKAFEQLEQCEKLSSGKAGVRWVRNSVESVSRRHNELRQKLEAEVQQGLDGRWTDELFLADYVFGQTAAIQQANENLKLLDRMRPIYDRQPEQTRAPRRWLQQRIGQLQVAGQYDQAVREQRRLAESSPHDYSAQQQFAQMLYGNGDYDAAYAWIERALGPDAKWLSFEEENLRNTVAQFLDQQGRFADLAKYLANWANRNPDSTSVYQQYLSALVQNDEVPRAEELMRRWLKEGQIDGPLSEPVSARLSAAISMALGQGYRYYSNRVDEKWFAPLSEVALFFARRDDNFHPADLIMQNWRFQSTDECRQIRRTVAGLLAAEVATLKIERLRRYVEWSMSAEPALPVETWKKIATDLEARWAAEADSELRHQLAGPLVQALTSRVGTPELVAFLRRQLREGPEEHRAAYAGQLFDTLLGQPWSLEIENESLALIEQLSDAEEPAERLLAQVGGLYRWTDRMVAARQELALKEVPDLEQLPRTERRQKTEEVQRQARENLAARLREARLNDKGALAPWLLIEQLTLDVQAERNLGQAADECWEFLKSNTAKPQAEEGNLPERRLAAILRGRFLTTIAYLAARKGAEESLVARLLGYIDEHLAAEPEADAWKVMKFRTLVALDRAKELQAALADWVKADDAGSRWRLALGYLLAERGAVPEAIALFEGTVVTDELGPREYQALAGWYQAANRRDDYERAQVRVYQTSDEWRMSRRLQRQLDPWSRTDRPLPSELDPQVLLMFRALFEKSGYPENHVWVLQQFYQATRDFRLLAVLADATTGRTAERVYSVLASLQPLLTEVRDEATADQLVEHVGKRREEARSEIDRRALDLVELLVERRAAELINQPGPHAARALAAMQRAFAREWSEGEPRLMADLLARLGNISQKPLADEQLRELASLHERGAPGSFDRLHIALRMGETRSAYGRPDEAADLLEGALAEFQNANGGVLPVTANEALAAYVRFLQSQGHFARGEKALAEQLKHPVHGQQRLWLTQRLFELDHQALSQGGTVSIGSGNELFRALQRRLNAELETGDQNHRYYLAILACQIYRTAHDRKLPSAVDDLRAFASRVVPEVLKRQTSNYTSIVSQVAQTLHDLAGPREGLAFLIERIEKEPGWFPWQNQDGWSQYSGTLAVWRRELGNIGDLTPRLLKIVVAELRRDLESQQQRNRYLYAINYDRDHFWSEQAAAFAEVADDFARARSTSGSAIQYVAEYLFFGLDRYDRAIELLFIAHREKRLDVQGQQRLVNYLHQRNRFGESIALLESLVDEFPQNIDYRVWLMHAYFRTGRKAELLALLKQTDGWFHEKDQWNDHVLRQLAESCISNQLYEQAIEYYEELIPRHEQNQPNGGIGDGTLSTHYGHLSLAFSRLHRTAKAVDAAVAAIVSWGPTHRNRADAIRGLQNVLREAEDLDKFVSDLDAAVDALGKDRPVVRKSIGQAYLERGGLMEAIRQLQRAVDLAPNDLEIHQALVAAYDRLGDREGAVRQLLQSAELSRRNPALYQDLGKRYDTLERPRDAERARTSIVEVQPHEAENHALLAGIRQEQNRWDAAARHWEQVARLRALEPTGLLNLAAAQIRLGQAQAAAQTLRKLERGSWPARYGDVYGQARELERRLEARPK